MTMQELKSTFRINGNELRYSVKINDFDSIDIGSVPRRYTVEFRSEPHPGSRLALDIEGEKHPLVVIDRSVLNSYMPDLVERLGAKCFLIDATEEAKTIDTVLRIVDFLALNNASKTSMIFAVGGGIVQDLCAFSAYLYKRGIPWTFVPTTLLAQGDSSVGGKTALNHKGTKNLLALFSAPRRIITDTGFLVTLSSEDWMSGAGEILRLCLTGGESSLLELESRVDKFVNRDLVATAELLRVSLAVKKAVVEFDEFEIDVRRSMNFGHSFGHALEILSEYKIAHGSAVTLGMLVEAEISFRRGMLPLADRTRIFALGQKLLSSSSVSYFTTCNYDGLISLLTRDKKSEGSILKLATLEAIGKMEFIDITLDAAGEAELAAARLAVSEELRV
jgi:3-dehydroquinate synthase